MKKTSLKIWTNPKDKEKRIYINGNNRDHNKLFVSANSEGKIEYHSDNLDGTAKWIRGNIYQKRKKDIDAISKALTEHGYDSQTLFQDIVDTVSGKNTDTVSGKNTDTVSGKNTDTVSGKNTDTVSGKNTDTVSGKNTDSGGNITNNINSRITPAGGIHLCPFIKLAENEYEHYHGSGEALAKFKNCELTGLLYLDGLNNIEIEETAIKKGFFEKDIKTYGVSCSCYELCFPVIVNRKNITKNFEYYQTNSKLISLT